MVSTSASSNLAEAFYGRLNGNFREVPQFEELPAPPFDKTHFDEFCQRVIQIHAERFGTTLCGCGECSWLAAWEFAAKYPVKEM